MLLLLLAVDVVSGSGVIAFVVAVVAAVAVVGGSGVVAVVSC